jgi:Tfp pilus assembly protein PilN
MMQRIEIDFVRQRRSSPWAGRLLFVVALAVAADTGNTYFRLSESLGGGAAAVAATQPRIGARRVPAEEVAAAREAVERLSMPWGRLFGALEQAASPQVALLAIEPDPRTGVVTISGEGKDYLAALTYVLNLRQAESLSNVQLVRHEQGDGDPRKPVAFSVSASWGTR